MASHHILLARPHPFIVEEMVPFLSSMGIGPLPPPKDGSYASITGICGAVISTALRSDLEASPEEVLAKVRAKWPTLPVMVATLMSFDATKRTMDRAFRSVSPNASLVPVSEETARRPDLGKPEVLLVVTKEDLANPSQRDLVGRIVARHLCG